MILAKLKKLLLSVHFLTFLGLMVLALVPFTWPVHLPGVFWLKEGIALPCWAGLFYLNLYVLVPRVLYKGHGFLFVLIVFIAHLGMLFFNRGIDILLNFPALMEKVIVRNNNHIAYKNSPAADFGVIVITLIIFGISSIVGITQKLNADKAQEQDAAKEKVSTELAFLKAQINPHFFFNILHTIYALTDTNIRSARESIYTLSHMMRYVLYDTKNDFTTLEKEIEFVQDYINLMQLRLPDQAQIIFEKPNILTNIQLAPMLFLPYIENAYKHGISNMYPSYIFIGITQWEQTLQLEVRNSIFNEHAENLEDSNGIGLVNTRRRLDLIYPGKYVLKVERDDKGSEFTIQLKLNLL
ncbi:sensor histidine kinase [Mucilaginibacter sp. X5P1]|uniref:sensor histidine kinase n=1 Tax=Mucilaginibacter sp. X5P1 TaxID=2723088 RepID=UPI0016108BBC|nr:histidine kinase [Mucilaginibacter sp. X5P1]MBB6137934.1 hypothetical protein [Mucilaginibacter sp. X5P1]